MPAWVEQLLIGVGAITLIGLIYHGIRYGDPRGDSDTDTKWRGNGE